MGIRSVRELQIGYRVLRLHFVGLNPTVVSSDKNLLLTDASGVDFSSETEAKGQVLT